MSTSLVDLLFARARETPDAVYVWHGDRPHSYAAVADGARRCQARLAQLGVERGQRVLLFLSNGPLFFLAYFGALLHGAVPVPLAPRSSADRARLLAMDCEAAAAIGDEEAAAPLQAVGALGIPVVSGAEATRPAPSGDPPRPGPEAFIQYTSGSTGAPKGALVSQRAVLANIAAFARRTAMAREDVFSSMMPLYHDMGLVCFGLAPLYLGSSLVLFHQEALSLYRWLESFGRHRVTVSGGPNALLHLAVRVVRDPSRYDLASLRMFVCGSEPVSPETVRRFEETYGVPGRVRPAYGMAELTLCVTITGEGEDRAVRDGRTISCGRPIDGVTVLIDPGGAPTREPFVQGEILVSSPSLMEGYVGGAAPRPRSAGYGLFRTGDVGFLDREGRLYVVGREKNLIIRAGAKLSPADVEALSLRWPSVTLAAAVGLPSGECLGERFVLVLEVAREVLRDPGAQRALAREICSESQRSLGYRPDEVVLAPRGRIPLALNGKVRHAALREQLVRPASPAPTTLGAAELT